MAGITVHMVANAHLDPVWLWTWPAGLDEALNTCRTACDLLDDYPELVFTRGEAWVHEQVRRLDPGLFERVRRHAAAGRWQAVNGWWVQPDCNLPSAESFRRHAEVGGRWFREHLGVEVTVGYNVDSFGHCATLPRFLRQAGMDSYVFMRPGAHEQALPADLFLWRSPDGAEILACRLNHGYPAPSLKALEANLRKALDGADPRLGHAMCFYGIGDHGGGPTRKQIEWIREHRDYAAGVELRFSHPRAFFDAVEPGRGRLPAFTGELHYHAVGCYSVVHGLKQEMRRAEDLLAQAGRLARARGTADRADVRERLDRAWERVLFNQFHDVLGGSSIAGACEHARDELGLAKTLAREVAVEALRLRAAELPPCQRQRVVLANASDRRARGPVEFEPWLGWERIRLPLRLTDAAGRPVRFQRVAAEAAAECVCRLLAEADVPALGEAVLEIHQDREEAFPSQVSAAPGALESSALRVELSDSGVGAAAPAGGPPALGPGGVRLAAFVDRTDTWSHGADGYARSPLDGFFAGVGGGWTVTESGPLRAAAAREFRLGGAALLWQALVSAGQAALRLRLRLCWQGADRVVKLLVPAGFRPARRLDGCPGGEVPRELDGREYPVRDFVALEGLGASLAVVTPDAYGADVLPDGTIRLTLLRCPPYAYHEPFRLPSPDLLHPRTDQGVHEYAITLLPGRSLDLEAVRDEAARLALPVWMMESTKGMRDRRGL